ncbi:hypothetical protein BJ875DRAFT_387853, partial [Amylocarpus encephaloides]
VDDLSIKPAARKKLYTDTDKRALLRHVRLHPKDTYAQVKIACGLGCLVSTIKKILKEHRINN